MLKWLSGEEGAPGSKGPGSPRGAAGGDVAVEEMTERLTQTEQLVTQLKELIREKDAALHAKDDQLKVEKEACEAKLSKLRLQNKAKVTSLSNQLEELKKQQSGQGTPTHSKKGSSEADQASRGKIVLLKKKVEELEQQVAQRDEELDSKRKMLESQRQRGEEMDAMLTEKNRKLAEKEAYIVHLQTALAGDQPVTPAPQQKVAEDSGAMAELQLLVQSLTRKVGEAEERYSLLQEQTDSLRELLSVEKEQYGQKETMYEQNIQTFKDIILQKDNQLTEINQMHEQELFRLAAKSDASADLEQLLKALKQKLHEKEEVLLGKTQVIDVLQGEVDGRDQQIKELTERLCRLQVERESLESKMEAEKHVMRAQLRDLMEKQQAEVQRLAEQHQAQVNHLQQDLLGQLEVLRKTSPTAPAARQEEPSDGQMFTDSMQRIAELEAQAKQKSDEASRSEAKFLKMKAWSKSRIRQLEEELKKSQAGGAAPDLTALRSRVTALEEEREENLWKVEQYEELKTKNDMLEAKLVVYEEQQRTLQADLEQFTKRAASQASESGSADDAQSQVLEWQEMVAEAASARDRAREEKAAMVLRISHMDEEREALATRQQELEEELAQARGLGHHRAKKLAVPSQRSLQDDFEFDGQAPFQDSRSSESTTPMEGENMGGGLRSVVEELELERNQLQEQILSLEERCQDLEDRLQLQARIETLQNECEKLQSQLASVRSQQSRDAEKHQLLVNSLNEQLKGLNDTQECLESSLIEKENALAKTSEKLELISSLRDSLSEKETQYKDVSEKLSQTELTLENVSKKCSSSEKQCSELKTEVSDLLQKLSVLKERTQKQEVIIETFQTELDQTNEELDKLNTTHLEERAQFIHDLQSCEREIDGLKDILLEKDKEISSLSGNMAEYAEQVTVLKQEIRLKEEHLVHVERALSKAEQEAVIIRDSQTSDQQALNSRITELVGKLRDNETELVKSKEDRDSKVAEVENLIKQVEEDKKTIQDLRGEIQKQSVSHRSHRSECETHITSLKEQLALSAQKLQESEGLVSQLKDKSTSNEKLQQQLDDTEQTYEKERKAFKEEHNKLVSQVEKYNDDIQMLSKQLEERVQREEHIKKEIQGKLETIASLENQLKANEQQAENERQKFNSELQVRDSENHKLSSELQSKSESVSKLKNALKGLKTEKQELQDNLKLLNEELELQKNCAKELQDKVTSALELNSRLESQIHSLKQDKQTLERTVAESRDAVCEVTAEKESLLAKISTLETQLSQNATFLEGLQKDKEELTLRNNELSRGLEHSTHSNSEVLLAKTNECSQLSQLLRQSDDKVTHLQEQVQRLTSAVDQLQHRVADKEQTAANLQSQQTHLQETLSHLQEQECRLKSAMAEKQDAFHRLQNELSAQNSVVSKLQAEADLLCEERSQLRQQVEHKEELLQNLTQQCHKHKEELDETNKTIKALSGQLGVMEQNARRLEAEAELRTAELLSLNSRFHSVTEENQQLRAACESREKELARETQLVSDLHSQLEAALEQNSGFSVQISSLTADNQRLQEELAHNIKSICEVTRERTLLHEKNRGLESQISDNQKTIEGLMKTNEELTFAADEITKILKETEKSNSAGLLEKTSECANLSKMLREREEQLQNLQEQVEGSKMEVGRLDLDLNERERTVSEQSSQLEAQQNQLLQLQDTISMLQEQGSVLKSGLMEKDAMCQQKAEECSVYEKELQLHKDLLTRMQAECLEATKQVERKEQELSKRNESVLSLSSQLGAMNESAAATEAELSDLKAAVEKVTAENSQLSQEMGRSKAEVADFNDCVQALNEQNAKLKSELQKTVTALSRAQEDVSDLKAAVSDLENELKTMRSEKESIHLTVQGKDESLKQQEALVQQLSSTVAMQDEQMKQKERDRVSLTAKVSELEDCVSELRSQVDGLRLESFTLKDTLEKKEQSRLEDQSHSAAEVESLTSSLHAKEEECESFKEQISHLEESLSKLNSTLQTQAAEVETLKKAMEEKETALQDALRRAHEALLFKSQFMESTESVSRLQSRIQSLSTESENLRRSAEETQSAFNNLQEKYAANLEELQDVKKQLSQQSDEVSNLRRLLDSSSKERQVAHTTIETLSSELEVVRQKLRETEDRNSSLSTEKEEAFASHQASVSVLTVEIERLKAQHLQVVAQMNALTENLEQREMALHAINSQYTAQAKRASQLVSEIQKLEEQNKRLNEEISLSKDEHQGHLNAVRKEDARLQQEVTRLRAEKEELDRRHHQILTAQGDLQLQMEQQSSSMIQVMSEKESLQAKVSAKDEELSELRENIQKVEQVLQDSEKEWLLVLDREKQHKNLLAEQLRSVENEMKAKDLKVIALKQDLDSLHEKLVEASSAVRQGSDQLSAKELEASASRIQLEKVLATVQEKEDDNNTLQQTLKTVELELHKLLIRKTGTDEDSSASPDTSSASLQDLLKQLGEAHKSEVDALKNDLGETVAELQQAQKALNEGERTDLEQLALLQESVELLRNQLKAETEKVKEAAVKHSTLHSESRAKDEQISCMSIQISQQKELLAGLSQQLRDKDASIAQVMEAASNERMKLSEDKMSLIAQLESTEQAHASSMKGLEDVSQQLEERLLILQRDVETKNSEKRELIMRNEDLNAELATVTKGKEALKKKLQAALILRKDLLKKLEQSENQREQGLNDERQKLEEVTSQAQVAENAHQEQVAFLEKNILEKEAEILELKMQSERVVNQAETLQTALNEKETRLSEMSRTLDEKNTAIEQLQSVSAERERNELLQKLEELQSEVKSCKDELKEKSSSAAAVVDLESELAQMKSEKATLQKKAQAALVARKETMKKAQEREKKLTQELAELKDDYKALLEQHCQQTNELNAVQLNFDENVRQLEEHHKACLSHRDEVDTLRQLVEERDETLQDLKMTLAEKESQCHALSRSHTEMENLKSTFHSMSLELTNKDEALSIAEQSAETLKSKLQMVKIELEKAHVELRQKTEDVGRYQEAVRGAEQEKDLLLQSNTALKTTQEAARADEKYEVLVGQKEALSAQCRLMKAELDAAVALVTQKSLEMSAMQKASAEKQQRLSDDLAALIEDLEKAKLRCTETENSLDLVKQDKDDAVRLSDELRDEVVSLKTRLKEAEELNQQQRTPETSFVRETPPPCNCAERVEVELKEKDAALTGFQTQLSEKEELVAALESQLQHQIQMHETVVQKMRADAETLQRESTSVTDQDNQRKIALLTRKLQAALVSRKELKEEVEKLSAKHKAKETEVSALESSVLKLEKLNMDLEGSVSSLNREKVQLGAEVERILNENRSLSAACDSLKLTIESITQQKQAFSCQLESLKDSQTEELSKWRSEHAELKQEYESLLQAYENVSSEMDKMRQLVEGAKRDRQEALRKMHKYEGELKTLERQAREREEENESMKDRMRQFSKEKRQKIEELEEESQNVRRELTEMEGKHKMATAELTDQQQRLEAEICQMKASTEDLRLRLTELQAENSQLAENLEEANSSLKRKYLESSTYTSSMQLKLDEALSLNNSLTAQIEAQNTELGAQLEINKVLQKEKENLSERIETIQNDSEFELGKKDDVIKELQRVITKHSQETISLNEKVRILEDDKCLLQEELENVQEISDKVKNENEYLETVILKNSERIDELTESVNVLQSQNTQLSTQLAASKDVSNQVRQEKEEEQLKLVREFEQKLKDLQRGNEGSKNVKRELQELLKEKHQEINQLQQNCIKCQELILDLESSLKSSQSDCEQLEKEQKKTAEKISVLEATSKCLEAELHTHKKLLQEATEQMAAVQSERERLAAEVSQQRKRSEAQAVHQATTTADENQISPCVENESVLQRQIEELTYLKDQESQKLDELKRQLDSRDLQVNTLKRAAQTSEARLCALSSTPQDATNLWNDLYQKTLHEKDNQLLEQGFVIKRFLEDMRAKDKDVNELRVIKSRLERTLNEYSVAAAAQQRQLFVLSASNAELSESVELLSVQVKELSARAERTEQERNALMRQLADKDGAISQMQLNLQQTEKINADTDAQLLLVQSQKDKLQADFEKQEGISLQLRALLQSKDAEISSLLSCKDGQMSGYLEQLQANYRSQVAVYEDRLTSSRYQREKADKELRTLEAKMKSLQIKGNKCAQEKEQMAAKMESFKNSMVSLQSERERLTSEYRILEAKSELVLKGREGSADEGGAAKGLKHEIRKLLHQMDDLNSENAMLRAQLVRYREDLNQVLSLKDNQLKVLLKKQQDAIKTLEHQKAAAEKQSRESRLELQKEEEASAALKAELSQLQAQVATLRDEILSQKKERSSTSEGRVIVDLQDAVAAKAAECSDLQQKLLSDKILTDELTEKLHMVGNETDKKLAAAEEKYNSDLDAFEREVELMRSEREAADQRLAELAKDLLETEQQLSEARVQRQDMKDQNESLCKAMAALQNDRDQLIENFKILRNRYDEELREAQAAFNKVEQSLQDASSDLAAFSKERDLLVHKLKAVESKDPQTELNKLVDELSKALSSKEKELKQVALENNTYGRQLSAFSRSMASLQNDRDRLMDELVRVKRAVESWPASRPEAVASGHTSGGRQSEEEGPKMEELQQDVPPAKESSGSREEVTALRSDREEDAPAVKETVALLGGSAADDVRRLEAERVQLHRDLQRCMYEIQQRDQYFQQLSTKLQQAVEEKGAVSAQLRAVSQTLRDTQDRCHWLEGQLQGQAQGSAFAEVAPGAPQERSNVSVLADAAEATQLRDRLREVELSLTDERARRESAEEALRLAEDRAKSLGSRDGQRDFSIEMEAEEEWEALSLNPNQPLITRKVKGGMVTCRRWLRGRSLYFSRLLTSRARSRYFFLAYLLTIHVLVVMCLTGAL